MPRADDDDTIAQHRRRISEDEWRRTIMWAEEWLQRKPYRPRQGLPLYSLFEAYI